MHFLTSWRALRDRSTPPGTSRICGCCRRWRCLRYNRATQPSVSAATLAAAGVTSPYNRPSFFFGIVPAAMSEQLQPSYEFGPFSLDAGKRLLLRNGEPVPLAPKVLETLLALIENRERVLTKDELLKQVWGDTIVEEGGLARNVSVLRKTLGEKPDDHHYIVTVPARGYRFVADVRERRRDGETSVAHLMPVPSEIDRPSRGLSARRWLVLGGLAALGVGTFTYVLRPVRATDPGRTAITSARGRRVSAPCPWSTPPRTTPSCARGISVSGLPTPIPKLQSRCSNAPSRSIPVLRLPTPTWPRLTSHD